MIFDQHRVVFLHIPRTGGTSIEQSLADPILRHEHERLTIRNGNPVGNKHLDACRAEGLWGERFQEYERISIVRNPIQLVISQWVQNSRGIPTVEDFQRWVEESMILYPTSAEVDGHVKDLCPTETSAGESQCRFLATREAAPIRVFAFEHHENLVEFLGNNYGIEKSYHLSTRNPKWERTNKLPKTSDGRLDYETIMGEHAAKVQDQLVGDFDLWKRAKAAPEEGFLFQEKL